MRVAYGLYDEFKRSSWVFMVALGCLLFGTFYLYGEVKDLFFTVINGSYIYDIYIESILQCFYLPFALSLAFSQHRGKKEEFRGSMPYTADGLYFIRLLYGFIAIALVTLAQWLSYSLILGKCTYAAAYLNELCGGSVAFMSPLHFMVVLLGEYVMLTLVMQLVRNPIGAAFGSFMLALMPEMLEVPYQWVTDASPNWEGLYRIKYAFMPGIADNMLKPQVYNTAAWIYAAILAVFVALGAYINHKASGTGNSKAFYNKGVKTCYIVLCVLFALNLFETFFLQGGL